MTEAQALELSKDLERPVPILPYTNQIKKLFSIMYAVAKDSGMPIREKIDNYFPHVIKEGVLRNLQKDVDTMINLEKVLAKDNLSAESGMDSLIKRMVDSGVIAKDISVETKQALDHLRGQLGSYSLAFESLRKGINSE